MMSPFIKDITVNYDKCWVEEDERFILEFTPFYEIERIAEIFEDDGWCYSSKLTGADNEYLGSNNLEDAQKEVEDIIIEHFENEIDYNTTMLQSFKK